jgi:hypothetical protein
MQILRMAAVAGLCVFAAGCGTTGLTVRSQAAHAPASPTATVAVAGNRAAARAQAKRLLELARVPSGIQRIAHAPSLLDRPAMGTPGVSSLVDQVKIWRVKSPFAEVQRWLWAHRPRGLTITGTSGPINIAGQNVMFGINYHGKGRDHPAWQSADLEIGAARVGPHTTVIRVDAVVIWLDPRPIKSRPGAHPIRVTLAGGCPQSDRGVTNVTNPVKLAHRLLPAGRPTAGLRCRYDGLNGHPFQLVAKDWLNPRAAQKAAKTISAMRLSHTDGGAMYCPSDDGAAEIQVLAYPGRPDADLWTLVNGCGSISNGSIQVGGS